MNSKLYVKNPDESDLGRKIISHSISFIKDKGFEEFTFKKLAKEIKSTEAGVYRYFENKHLLLTYLTAWYWSWLEYQIKVNTTNVKDKELKLNKVIELIMMNGSHAIKSDYIDEYNLHQIIVNDSVKTYHNHRVSKDNKDQLFQPYKELCAFIGSIILEFNPKYAYPKSLASSIIEIAHAQVYFMNNLPKLTDFGDNKDEAQIISFLQHLLFSSLKK
jgi:AcrR family transcriptional regulator